MRTLHTEITISAPPSTVWKILTDFSNYSVWNPFILSVECREFKEGERLKASIAPPDSNPMIFTPRITQIKENQMFSWRGRLVIKGLFDGEHIFEIIPIDDNEILFVHQENFSGILVPFMWKSLQKNVKKGFELMNQAIKERSERMNEMQLHALTDFRLYEHLN